MNTIRIIACMLYSAAMLLAVTAQYRQNKKKDYPMAAGAMALLLSVFFTAMYAIVIAVCGLALMHVAAVVNGKRNGKLHALHHIIRLCISVVIIALIALA